MLPPALQSPRIPIWVPGVWQKPKSMERSLRWDGILPQKYKSMSRMTAPEIREVKQYVEEHREHDSPFDIIAGGETSGTNRDSAAKKVRGFIKAGATWWLESKWTFSFDELRERVKQGPPRVD